MMDKEKIRKALERMECDCLYPSFKHDEECAMKEALSQLDEPEAGEKCKCYTDSYGTHMISCKIHGPDAPDDRVKALEEEVDTFLKLTDHSEGCRWYTNTASCDCNHAPLKAALKAVQGEG